MKKPTSVKVMGFDYDIVWEPQQIHDGKEYNWGMCDNEKQCIQVWDGLTGQRKRQVLVHEIIHVIFELMAVVHGNEENVCDCVSLGLYCVLNDNPELMKWITNEK